MNSKDWFDRPLYWFATTSPRDFHQREKKDPQEAFSNLQYHAPSSMQVVSDECRGLVWLFDKQPNRPTDGVSATRCETSGVRFNESQDAFYKDWIDWEEKSFRFSWSSKFDRVTLGGSSEKFAIFQWKSFEVGLAEVYDSRAPYGPPSDNLTKGPSSQWYPFLMLVFDGRIELVHSNYEGEWLKIWEHKIEANQWMDIALDIFMTKDKDRGKANLYFNGIRQTFLVDQGGGNDGHSKTFRGRTLDTNGNYPKWGVYRNGHPEFAAKHYVDRLYIKEIGQLEDE